MEKYRLLYMEPPISIKKTGKIHEFFQIDFESAYQFSEKWIQENKKPGTQILFLAQLTR